MNLETFLDRLEGVTPRGNGYVAICPGHDDRQQSLGVTETDDRILINCHAGCDTSRVCAAMGIELRDLFFNAVNHAEPEATYDYVDERGELLFQAIRFPGKQFRQRHLDVETGEWIWNLEGVRRVLYRLPEVIAAIASGTTIYLVEGEKDVERLRAEGKVATCNPMGAGKWRPDYTSQLEGAHVVIVADRDEPGRNHAEAVKDALTPVTQALWVYQAKVGKDVSDHLDAGLELDKLTPMKSRVRRGIITARELAAQGLEDLTYRESDMPAYRPWESVPVEFRQGRAYAIGAYTGDGKTTMALQGFRALSERAVRCGYHTLEMPERDLRNKLAAHKGVPLRLTEHPWRLREDPEMLARYEAAMAEISGWNSDIIFDSSTNAEKIFEIARDREHEVVFVDHLHRFSWGQERRKLDEQVNVLTNMALELNITLIVLCQLRKHMRGKDIEHYPRPVLQDFRETSMIGDDASMALAVWRERPDGLRYTGSTQVIMLKNRHTTSPDDRAGSIYFQDFNPTTQTLGKGGGDDGGEQAEEPGSPAPDGAWIPT